jgi:hypothetical protein
MARSPATEENAMAPPNGPPVVHGQQLMQQVYGLVGKSLRDAEAHPETYSKSYVRELRKLQDQAVAGGARSPKDRLDELQDDEDAAFNDPAHRRLMRMTPAGRALDDERHRRD